MIASERGCPSDSPRAAEIADAADIAACFAADLQDQDTAPLCDDRWERTVTEEIGSGRSQFFVVGSPVHSEPHRVLQALVCPVICAVGLLGLRRWWRGVSAAMRSCPVAAM